MKQNNINEIREMFKKILDKRKEKDSSTKRKWTKLYGDVCVRIFREFLLKELPEKYTISQPYAYIEGFPYEFDLLIVDKSSKPIKYTNIYHPDDVRMGIEIKARGIYGGRDEMKNAIHRLKNIFMTINKKHPHINFIYFTYEERGKPKRKNSINYLDETIKGLHPYKVFCLKESSTGETKNEWKDVVDHINEKLRESRIK